MYKEAEKIHKEKITVLLCSGKTVGGKWSDGGRSGWEIVLYSLLNIFESYKCNTDLKFKLENKIQYI